MGIQEIEQVAPDQVPEKGYLMKGRLPSGRLLMVEPLLFSRARLGIGPLPPMADDGGFDDTWEFASPDLATLAFLGWDPAVEDQPLGWDWHPASGRYRINGDPTLEYVRIKTDKPLDEEIKRAVQTCSGRTLISASIEEVQSAYAKEGPKGTRSFAVSWSHDLHGKRCIHTDCALVYLDRCVILSLEDMVQLVKGLRSPATIRQRLTPGSHSQVEWKRCKAPGCDCNHPCDAYFEDETLSMEPEQR